MVFTMSFISSAVTDAARLFEVEDVAQRYGDNVGIDGLDLRVERGDRANEPSELVR